MSEHDERGREHAERIPQSTGSIEEVQYNEEEIRLLEEVSNLTGIKKEILKEQDLSSTASQILILNSFANKLCSNMQDIPPEFAAIVNRRFWDLLDDNVYDTVKKKFEECTRLKKKAKRKACRKKRKRKLKKRRRQQRKKR